MDPENQLDAETESAASEIISQMPDVQEHAIQAAESERAANTPAAPEGANVDKNGVAFDPEIHTGSKLKNGAWRERKKKDGSASKAKSVVASSGKTDSETAATNTQQVEARATGLLIATMILGACQSIGGEEWEPSQQERDFQVTAWQAYCLAKNMTELSPGWAVAISFGSYAAPRFAMPKTLKRASNVKQWFSIRIAKWKVRRELKKRGITAAVSIRGGTGFNAHDEILVNGKPLSEFHAFEKK